ncbi:hypothetical protein JMJ35_009603 [Cladonia borealis]|uniref:RING-type E3 ubiquitin transferase n=1 Tax=Cladonia borealis TaxID=184061 RepID=A0AA39QSQ3_9LECA|nr:hypothetical protein JMJ35_009603 [Cladonia borealis]
MPLTVELPLPSTSATSNNNPAPASRTPRPRLRGFGYLRSHGQPSSPTVPSSNATTPPVHSDTTGPVTPPTNHPSAQSAVNTRHILPSHTANDPEQQTCLYEGIPRTMARNRSGSAPNGAHPIRKTSDHTSSNLTGHPQDQMPTIRFIPHQDPRSARPSLAFPATARTLPHEDCVIRVGRYSERDTNPNPPPNTPSSAPVGFKSKVVSRRHCEFWCSQGQWYIKDVKSSSGTFLNHIRLSQPSVESKPFPVHDGDVVQLGIDFRGGEEMIFRCVKIRVECNRGWQKTLNHYNVTTHKRLRDLGKPAKKDSDTASSHSSECSICLMSIAPCQSLFVAPCSHVWHYKCIRPILNDHKSWPQFLCPNCRAVTDLEADVDDIDEDWGDEDGAGSSPEVIASQSSNGAISEHEDLAMDGIEEELSSRTSRKLVITNDTHLTPSSTNSSDPNSASGPSHNLLVRRGARRISPPFAAAAEQPDTRSASSPIEYLRPITPTQPLMGDELNEASLRTPTTTDMLLHDGPMTPTNNAGPFVFDGSAGRAGGHRMVNSILDHNGNTAADA